MDLKFLKLKQNNLSVMEYEEKFTEYLSICTGAGEY